LHKNLIVSISYIKVKLKMPNNAKGVFLMGFDGGAVGFGSPFLIFLILVLLVLGCGGCI
jgi:hypothetical protein